MGRMFDVFEKGFIIIYFMFKPFKGQIKRTANRVKWTLLSTNVLIDVAEAHMWWSFVKMQMTPKEVFLGHIINSWLSIDGMESMSMGALKVTKPVQTAVKWCQTEDRELQAWFRQPDWDTFGGVKWGLWHFLDPAYTGDLMWCNQTQRTQPSIQSRGSRGHEYWRYQTSLIWQNNSSLLS